MSKTPTLREVLAGYKQFNVWEVTEEKKILPQLTIEESLAQFFELCALARALAPNAAQVFFEEDKTHWTVLHRKLRQAAKVMGDAKTT